MTFVAYDRSVLSLYFIWFYFVTLQKNSLLRTGSRKSYFISDSFIEGDLDDPADPELDFVKAMSRLMKRVIRSLELSITFSVLSLPFVIWSY